jgi:hypothetical protein
MSQGGALPAVVPECHGTLKEHVSPHRELLNLAVPNWGLATFTACGSRAI